MDVCSIFYDRAIFCRYFDRTEEIFTNGPSNAPSDFTTQMYVCVLCVCV